MVLDPFTPHPGIETVVPQGIESPVGEARKENSMDEARIIQIIPAPADMLLKYKEDDGSVSRYRPLCIALVRYSEAADEVRIMAVGAYGMIDFADTASNFEGVDWREGGVT